MHYLLAQQTKSFAEPTAFFLEAVPSFHLNTSVLEKIYGKDVVDNVAFNDGNHDDLPMLCDENSTPDQIVDVANDGARALNAGRYSEARRLLTMAHIACGRQDPAFLYNRAHAYLADGR